MSGTGKEKALALVLAGWLPTAGATTFLVDSDADALDAQPGDGYCATAEGVCTLRAAVQEANALTGADTVQVQAGLYVLSLAGADEDEGATGDLDIVDDLHVIGAGNEATVLDGNFSDRLFHSAEGVTLRLEALMLQRGQVAGENGGGAVLAKGDLELADVVAWNNTAAANGGGIFAAGALHLVGGVLEDNTAHRGGGLFLAASGSATVEGSLLNANMAMEGAGLYALGALTVRTSTLSANQAGFQGGGRLLGVGWHLRAKHRERQRSP